MSMRASFVKEVIPGIVLGLLTRYTEITTCLFSECDSYILKTEKVLIHFGFVLGYASPSLLLWQMLKRLLIGAFAQLGTVVVEYSTAETLLKMLISMLEQYELAKVWDYVRDGSICLRFNNCEGDFLGQLNNIKIKQCNVSYPFDDSEKPSVCERLFNDSPLILLSLGMIILAMLSSSQIPPDTTEKLSAAAPSNSPGSKKGGSPGSRPSPSSGPNNLKPSLMGPNDTPSDHAVHRKSPSDDPPTDRKLQPPPTDPKGPTGRPKSKTPEPGKKTQVLHYQCPSCTKRFYMTVPRPWELCCSKGTGIIGTRKDSSKTDAISDEFVKQLLKNIKCEYCRAKIKKRLLELAREKQEKDAQKKREKDAKIKKQKKEAEKQKKKDARKKQKWCSIL